MSRRYHVDDLLKLRESPLIHKPDSLPEAEIWMGSLPDTNTRRTSTLRPKPDDLGLQGDGFQKRPNLLDHSRKSAASPPKFRGRRKSSAQDDADESHKSNENFQERHKVAESATEKNTERRGGRHDATNGKFMSRQEKEEHQSNKSRRKEDEEHTESRSRPGLDWERARPKWPAKEGKAELETIGQDKDIGEDSARTARRDVQARARFEQPWFRNERAGEAGDRRSDTRQNEWRRDREWDRSGNVEADPEWMDSTETEEPAQARTQEDFERWKERMKAGGTPAEEKAEPPSEIATESAEVVQPKRANKTPVAAVLNSAEMNDAMDKFFARFNEPKPDQDQKGGQGKAPIKTRFASLWSTPADPPASAPEPQRAEKVQTVIDTPSNANADQAGFARILQMLGSRSTSSTPQESSPSKPKTPLYVRRDHESTQEPLQFQEQGIALNQSEQLPRTSTSRNQESVGLERVLPLNPPTEGAHARQQSGTKTPKETSDILLNLMRQANINQQAQQNKALGNEPRPPPGLPLFPDTFNQAAAARNNISSANAPREQAMAREHAMPREQHVPQRRETSSTFFDEPQMSRMNFSEEHLPQDFQNNGMRRRPTNGPPPAFYDDPYLGQLRQNVQPQQKPPQVTQLQNQAMPPGLQRPPGLDQLPRMPPGWPNQPQQQQSQMQRQAPPPGIPNLPRGMPAPFGGSNQPMQLPPHLQQQPALTQQRPQRKYTGDSGPGPAYPLSMGPPPGFVNNGPPPGFPGAPQHYGRYQVGGEQQGMGRGYAEMYGSPPDRMPVRGGAPGPGGLPGGYR